MLDIFCLWGGTESAKVVAGYGQKKPVVLAICGLKLAARGQNLAVAAVINQWVSGVLFLTFKTQALLPELSTLTPERAPPAQSQAAGWITP
jgi:hypothetical protein